MMKYLSGCGFYLAIAIGEEKMSEMKKSVAVIGYGGQGGCMPTTR